MHSCFGFSSTGEVEFQRAVPDTLTSWVASAFAVSNSTGLGVGELKPQVGIQDLCSILGIRKSLAFIPSIRVKLTDKDLKIFNRIAIYLVIPNSSFR